jgi:hypothetical protein
MYNMTNNKHSHTLSEFGAGGPAFSSEGISKTDSAWKEKGGKPRARRPIAGFEVKIT